MSVTLTLCPGWTLLPLVLTCHYVGWDPGTMLGCGTLTSEHPWPLLSGELGRSRGPARGLLISNEVLLQLILLLRPVPAPAMTDQFYQLFFNPITYPILFTVSMYNNCLEWHLECSNKTGCVRVTRQRLGETQRMCSNLRLEFPW